MASIVLKKEILKFWGPIFIVLFGLSSCVYDKEFRYLNDQILDLNKRVKTIEKSQDANDKKVESDLKSIHSSQAGVGADLDKLKSEIKGLSGRIEDNEHIIKRTVERDLGEQDAIQTSQVTLSQRMTELDKMVKRIYEYLGLKPLAVQESPEEEKKETSGQGEVSPPPPGVEKEAKSKDVALYDISLASFKEENFEEAIDGFKDFIKKYPKSDRADNAHFWIGECYMALKQYEQAILAYQSVIKNYPKGNKVPNALLRQAIAFLEIKDKTSSKLLLKKIIKMYPKSSEAKIARSKLKIIK